jgi:hypothetical protein
VRSISGTIGTAVSATFYEQRYYYHVQRYAEDNGLSAMGLQEALTTVQHFLQWAGEPPTFRLLQTDAVLQQRLLAEATTVAYQDYFFIAALIGALSMLPALPWIALCHRLRALFAAPTPLSHPPPQEHDAVFEGVRTSVK